MKAIKTPVVLLITLILVMTFSVISSAVTDKTHPSGKYMKGKSNFNGKQKPLNAPDGSAKPENNDNSSSNTVLPSASQNNAPQDNASNNQAETSTNITAAQILVEINDIKKQTYTIIDSDNKNMKQINIQKSQVDNYIDYINKGSIVYNDDQLAQITTLLSKLTTDSQTVRSDSSTINSDITMVNTFSDNKNYKNVLIKLNDELAALQTRIPDINNVSADFTSTLAVLVQGQAVGSIINEPTASPANSSLVPTDNNTTN